MTNIDAVLGFYIFAGFVAHAWIAKIADPPPTRVKRVAWVVGGSMTILCLVLIVLMLLGRWR